MKLGSPEAMRQEPSCHDWEYERRSLEEQALEEEREALEEQENNERIEAMNEARKEYDAATPAQRAKVLGEEDECPHDEHDHGICLDCGKDVWDDVVASAEFRADCNEGR